MVEVATIEGLYLIPLTTTLTITLHAPWVHSLKAKRSIVKSLIAKLRAKFNVSVTESNNQDVHQTIVISVAYLSANNALSDSVEQQILDFVEQNCETEIVGVDKD